MNDITEAIQTVLKQTATHQVPIPLDDTERALLVPDGYHVETKRSAFAIDPTQGVARTFYDRGSMAEYIKLYREAGAIILANYDQEEVLARLTYHHPGEGKGNKVQENMHKATLKLRRSEEFARWDKFIQEGWHDQMNLARFLEENSSDVEAPDPARLIELSRDFQAEEGKVVNSKSNTQTGDRTLVFEQETKMRSEIVVPQKITLQIPLYYGESDVTLEAYFRYRANDGKAIFRLEWRRLEFIRQATFEQIAAELTDATGVPSFLGH